MDKWTVEGVIASPILWGFLTILATALAVSGKLDMSAAKYLLAAAWVMGAWAIYRFPPMRELAFVPRGALVMITSGVTGLLFYWLSLWMANQPDKLDQLIALVRDLQTRATQPITPSSQTVAAVAASPSPQVIANPTETPVEENWSDLNSASGLLEKEKSKQAAQSAKLRLSDIEISERRIKLYGPIFDYAIRTFTSHLETIAKDNGDRVNTTYTGIPTAIELNKEQPFATLRMEANTDWVFTASLKSVQAATGELTMTIRSNAISATFSHKMGHHDGMLVAQVTISPSEVYSESYEAPGMERLDPMKFRNKVNKVLAIFIENHRKRHPLTPPSSTPNKVASQPSPTS